MTLKKVVLISFVFSISVIFASTYKEKCDELIVLKVTKEHDLETLKDQRRALSNQASREVINHIDSTIQKKEQELANVNNEIEQLCRNK